MTHVQHPPIKRVMNHLRQLSADEETRRLAEVRERALFNEYLQMSDARQEGIDIGIEQGLEQGLEQGRKQGLAAGQAQVLSQLLAIKFGPLDQALTERLKQANAHELSRWTERLLLADDLEKLFAE